MTLRKKWNIYLLTTAFILPLYGFSQETVASKDEKRVEITYKQRHGRLAAHGQDLYADGIKIQRDLSLIDKAQEARLADMDEIPCDDLYGGIWSNDRVNIYSSIDTLVPSYRVDLANFTIPTMGYITSNFGKRRRRMHYGIDLKVQTGDTIYAAFDGKVRLCQYERKGYGYYVVLRHPNGLETVYGHLSRFLVSENDVVKSGDPIALGGSTGRSTGPHLHFEFRFLGKPINPNYIVDFDNKVCHRDEYIVSPSSFEPAYLSPIYTRSGKTNKYVQGTVAYHRVQQGDSLYKIARAYGTTVSNICRLNKLTEKSQLRKGQVLRVS
ncbi:MAG: peptidoglycan DD-metalloendopeptidase family protein [Prevotella sp.]|nr:peptidoglycan DD-metalloendopeptidase family protein [Prevotella sp.]